jgi:glycosyltransferase involved in cell wall biosynthesis
MPVHNGAKYIREAIDSLLAQRYINLELIISDNASTDETAAICQEYLGKDQRVRLFTQELNSGPTANFSFVLGQAQGKYFMWAACDDVWDVAWVERLVDALRSSRTDKAAFGRLLHIDEESEIMPHPGNYALFPYLGPRIIRRMRYFLDWEMFGKANPFYAVYKTDVLRGIELSAFAYDFHMLFHVLRATRMLSVPDVIIRKRVHAGSLGEAAAPDHGARRLLWVVPATGLVPARLRGFVDRTRWLAGTVFVPAPLIWWLPLLPGYLRDCSVLERCVLVPLAVVKAGRIYCSQWSRRRSIPVGTSDS